jgi:hypothetical protein
MNKMKECRYFRILFLNYEDTLGTYVSTYGTDSRNFAYEQFREPTVQWVQDINATVVKNDATSN